MRVDLFDFELPETSIALRPVRPRDAARMLVVKPGGVPEFADHGVLDLPEILSPGDALVFNDTRVIPAQIAGTRRRKVAEGEIAAGIDLTLHLRTAPDRWQAFARPAKKLVPGDLIAFDGLDACVTEKRDGGEVGLQFSLSGEELDHAIARIGHMPLPPYIALKRGEDAADREDYQTIYARNPGAVAAPTAGLHTTERLLKAITARGISIHHLTLHVGAGTFLPMKVDDTGDHHMHAEWGMIDAETAARLQAVRDAGGRIAAVGTTSLRLLESAASRSGRIEAFAGETDIFITPGYRFKAVDLLMTNFHLPRSTLFMLVSAFSGLDRMQRAYAHAISSGYRFYSYGDASLLFLAEAQQIPQMDQGRP